LSATFGRGAATTYQEDLQNSDCILIMGSNMAEAHPVGFRFVMRARERGAKVIHVDPHFSRTSACATQYVPLRTGTDIVFLGGIINQVLLQDRWFKEYVQHYTNASTIINEGYVDAEDNEGIFSGFRPDEGTYHLHDANWHYAGQEPPPAADVPEHAKQESWSQSNAGSGTNAPERDPTFQHPNCVLNILRRHYARYTPQMVADTCGCTVEQFMEVAESMMSNSGRERTGAIVYALGWTQHTTGVQMIRTAAMLQLLLGNAGRPGGGIMAMRGHASIQGSTDIPTLYNLLPGYLLQPTKGKGHETLEGYLENEKVDKGYWSNMPKFMVSLLKAWYGDAATLENDYGFGWLPRTSGDHSQLCTFTEMSEGKVNGLFLMGQNPAVGAPNSRLNRKALTKLDWLVVRDFFLLESATFWNEGPDNPDPSQIGTEVFFLPAAAGPEKPGTLTNTQRLLQWHDKAVDPPGDCRSDLWFMYNLGRRLRQLYAGSTRQRDQGLLNLTWDYAQDHPEILPDGTVSRIQNEPDAEKVLREINGYRASPKSQVQSPKSDDERHSALSPQPSVLLKGFEELKDDGTTACGCWIYCGVYPEEGRNRASDRPENPKSKIQNPKSDWAWAWPANRRMMYNRASADPEGNPWSERKRYIWWDPTEQKWTGLDTPDFPADKPPTYRSPEHALGMEAIDGDSPFIMHSDGKGWLFAPSGIKDGPLPTHYEPIESPARNPLYAQDTNPTTKIPDVPLNPITEDGGRRTTDDSSRSAHRQTTDEAIPHSAFRMPQFPIVATTYRLTEHYLSGGMSRFDSWLNELQPAMFVEMSPELAEERGITHGDWIIISSPRGEIEARAMVTPRLHTLTIQGERVHQIGVPIHFGYTGEVTGGQANELIPIVVDANVSMHEGKSFMCDVRKGRLSTPSDVPSVEVANRPTAEPATDTPHQAQPEGKTA
jgi:formate dehydrogenase major subunit